MTPYEVITERICGLLEKGVVPWRKPWTSSDAMNGVSRKAYRGINWLLLNSAGYANPYWLTFRQAKGLGGNVRKGEHGWPCVFWKRWEVKDEDAEQDGDEGDGTKSIPIMRYYTVFNVLQCEGLDMARFAVPTATRQHTPIEAAEKIVQAMPQRPPIKAGNRACYSPLYDEVTVPPAEAFVSGEEYYCVLFHELTHSTGHAKRLGRLKGQDLAAFGSQTYSKEELVAEMGAAFLCADCGIVQATLENSAAYVANWLGRLRADARMVVFAGAQAQKAADFIRARECVKSEAGPARGQIPPVVSGVA